MNWIDWSIIGMYVVSALAIGVLFTKKAGESTADFFVAGRSLPWWIAGTSIVATTFSADTPLFVAGLARTVGISGNWFWWSGAIGTVASIFFFAKLWRRTQAVTDVEFLVLRYNDGAPVKSLRVFNVFYNGVFVNCVVMASVTLAMAKIMKVMLHLSDKPLFTVLGLKITSTVVLLVILGGCAVFYTTLSGLYGVVYTDLIQFALAMIGSIGLAIVVYIDASKGAGLMANLRSAPDFKETLINFIPDLSTLNLPAFAFYVFMFMAWWAAVPSGGYFVQRLLACKSEKDSVLAFLWFNFLHFVVRSWPWVLVGVLSLITFHDLKDAESAFPMMIDKFLPVGLKGAMVASLLAAFMSTLDTQLNWGTSYLINDFYEPYVAPKRSEEHYVAMSRIFMLLLTVAALVASAFLSSILDAYKYLGLLWGGVSTVLIARWYWWRVNPQAEIAAIATALTLSIVLALFMPDAKDVNGKTLADYYTIRLLIVTLYSFVMWVTVALATSRKPSERAVEFYKRMRIPGPGWRKVAELTGVEPEEGQLMAATLGWIGCVALILGLLVGVGKLLFHEWGQGSLGIAIAVIGGIVMTMQFKKLTFTSDPSKKETAETAEPDAEPATS